MNHPIYRITSFEHIAPYTLRLRFDDGLCRTINFKSILEGEPFDPLRDPAVFAQVSLDPEVQTVVWPSGADFDPASLHDGPDHEAAFRAAAQRWRHCLHQLNERRSQCRETPGGGGLKSNVGDRRSPRSLPLSSARSRSEEHTSELQS